MKKISNVLLSVSILLITLMLFVVEYNKDEEVYKNKPNTFKTNNALAIMLDDGNGNYNPSDSNAFPTSGYTFNSELSKCENGGEVTWDDTNKKVIVSSNVSDKCYIYFDKVQTFADHIKGLYTTQGANNLYHHDGTLENGIDDGSYRYAGSYEITNNWVCFGTDAETCDDEHLYRIIGVFGDQVKLIKSYEGTEASLGTTAHGNGTKNATYYKGKLDPTPGYYWTGSSSNSSNNWTTSTLNTNILNGTYLNTLGTKWSGKIANTKWKIAGNLWSNIGQKNAATAYQNEIVNPTTNSITNAKVGLMYVSDYGYAASPVNWTTNLSSYDNDTNRNNNWIYIGIHEWTISPYASTSNNTLLVRCDGYVNGNLVNYNSGVRPSFYLNSNVMFAGGSGTEIAPYRVN